MNNYSVCRLSGFDESDSVKDLLLYESKCIEGVYFFLLGHIMSNLNFGPRFKRINKKVLIKWLPDYEIYAGIHRSPRYSSNELVAREMLKLVNFDYDV